MTRKDDKGDPSSGGETTWTNTGATRSGIGKTAQDRVIWRQHAEVSSKHGTQRLPND